MRSAYVLVILFFLFPGGGWCKDSGVDPVVVERWASEEDHIHDPKNPYDLHNITVSAFAIMELEILKAGDYLLDLPRGGREAELLERAADTIEATYQKIPQVRPIRRLGQLFDALQLRQVSFADLRVAPTLLVDPRSSLGLGMQNRINKLIRVTEDLVDDTDQAVMAPVNLTVSRVRRLPTRVKTIGYVGDGLGWTRVKGFRILKRVNKEVVKAASNAIDGVETAAAYFKNKGRREKIKHFIVYLKMPAGLYEANRSFFAGKAREIDIPPDPEIPRAGEVLIAVELRELAKAPDLLGDYVIDSDEMEALIYGKPSPRSHLKLAQPGQ